MTTESANRTWMGQMKEVADSGDRVFVDWAAKIERAQRAITNPLGDATRAAFGAARALSARVAGESPATASRAPARDRARHESLPRLPVLLEALEQVIAEHEPTGRNALRQDERFWRLLHLLQAHRPWARRSASSPAAPEVPADPDKPVLLSAASQPRRGL